MAKLEELEEDLYGKDESAFSGRSRRRVLFPHPSARLSSEWNEGAKQPPQKKSGRVRRLAFFLSAAGFLFVAGGAIFVYLYIGRQIPEATVMIRSRDFLEAGEEFTIPISVANTSKTPLREPEIALVLPPGSLAREEDGVERPAPPRIVKTIADLAPGEQESVEIVTRMFGKEGDLLPLEATLSYRPENLKARFSVAGTKQVTIANVPLALSWDGPDTVSQKQDVTVRAHVHSTARSDLNNLWLRVEYPPGFTFASSEPKPDAENNFWRVDTLTPGAEAVITIHGAIAGASGEIKIVQGGIGIYDQLTRSWSPWREAGKELKVATNPLSLALSFRAGGGHVVVPGERLEVALSYRNNSDIPLKNVSVSAALEGSIIDQSSLNPHDGGAFDSQTGSLVWSPGGTSALQSVAPGAGGDLTFSVSLRPQPAVRTPDDKNLTVKIHSRISAASIPEELHGTQLGMEDVLEMKVQSKVLFSGRALFHASPIPTSGSLPPRVGQKTVYTIVWEVRNFTDDLDTADIRVSLPPNVTWENAMYPKDAGITYDAASGEVRWHIGTLPAGTGILTPALIGAFQVSVVPAVSDAGRTLMLTGQSRLTGHDTFTDENRDERLDSFSTQLTDDPLTSSTDWVVVK